MGLEALIKNPLNVKEEIDQFMEQADAEDKEDETKAEAPRNHMDEPFTTTDNFNIRSIAADIARMTDNQSLTRYDLARYTLQLQQINWATPGEAKLLYGSS